MNNLIARYRWRGLALIASILAVVGLVVATGTTSAMAAGITKDASAPAAVLKTNSTATTESTASFSPPAGSRVIVEESIAFNHNTTTGPTVTAKDSLSNSYTANVHSYDGAAEGSYVLSHYYTTAPGAITVTVTRSGATGAAMLELDVLVLDGTASSQTGAATAATSSHGSTHFTGSITTTASGSWAVADATVGANETLTASGITNDHVQGDANDGVSSATGHAVTGTPGAETIGWTGSSSFYAWSSLEVLPAASSLPPAVTTSAATGVTSSAATLNGTVNPESQSTTYHFEYGTTTSYGTLVPIPDGSAGSGSTAVAESASLTGLTASTTYHFRLDATNATGTTDGADQQFTTSASGSGQLIYSPPACGGADGDTCTTINLSASGSQNPTLASNVDYKLIMPSTPIAGGTLTISGGHNVQIIGGEIDLNNPCTDSCSAEGDGAIYITDGNAGEVYLEGIWIHNLDTTQDTASSCPGGGTSCSTADGIDVNVGDGTNVSNPPLIVMQNLRIDGISGCSGGSDHADVIQPYNDGPGTIDIDHLTGTTNCQGMTIDPDFGFQNFGTLPNYNINNVNIDVLNNPYSGDNDRYGWWLTYHTACNSGDIALNNAWESEPDGTLSSFSVWPDTSGVSCPSTWNSTTKQSSFPDNPNITGVLNEGTPPGGDYVPTGVAGIGYVSPGYQ